MRDNSQAWLKRAEEILKQSMTAPASEAVQFTISMMTALYGPESPQIRQFREGCAAIAKASSGADFMNLPLRKNALGAIQNTIEELKAGLIVRVRVAVAGEILAELITLAKEIMVDHTEEAKTTAAVLVAAAYEGLIRRLGQEFAGITDRPKLEEVIRTLKNADVLKGGEAAVAQSYLKFRNDSLHADWKNVGRSQVESCLAFSESLLLKHFAV